MNSNPIPPSPRTQGPIDLSSLAALLKQRFEGGAPRGYLPGKTRMRDALQKALRISALRAEILIDQLSSHGFLRYLGDPKQVDTGRDPWTICVNPHARG